VHDPDPDNNGQTACPDCAAGVEGKRVYIPLLFQIELEGVLEVRHFDMDTGQSLDAVFPNYTKGMTVGQKYPPEPPSGNKDYGYAGYKKSTTGAEPSGTVQGDMPSFTYDGTFDKYMVNFYYKKKPPANGTIHVRQMVRIGQSGSYVNQGETPIGVATLPDTRTISADSSFGTIKGYSLNYSGSYSDAVTNGSSTTVNLTASQKDAYVSFFYEKPAPVFTGDFDVIPGTITFRDSFTLHPKNFQLNGCAYISHQYKIERSGTYTSPAINGQYTDTTYSYSDYPWNIGVGTHWVSMKITTSCGTSGWIGPKMLDVTSPTLNNPPQFKIGFVAPNYPMKPLTEVVQGRKLDLIYIDDPSVPTPFDIDGDSISFNGFDFAAGNAFIQSIPSKGSEYDNGYHSIAMDTLGYHYVTGMMSDQWGATSTASTWIHVVPPNPVPIAGCPETVIENHPVPASAFDASRSYSPLGKAINHSRDEWTNKLTAYPNGTDSNITTIASLHVYDSDGLKSIDPGYCSIVVKPDLPPVAMLDVPPKGIRNQTIDLYNKSISPDGDAITSAEYKYKYDDDNNGFADDPWTDLTGTLVKAKFNPTMVGKYIFYLKVTEEYGKSGDTSGTSESSMTLDVINDAPEVSFEMEGKNPQPSLDPLTTLTANQMLAWPVYETNGSKLVYNKNNLWSVANNKLVSGEGRNFGPQLQGFYSYYQTRSNSTRAEWDAFALPNNGYGNNRLSPWRAGSNATTNPQLADSLVDPETEKYFEWMTGLNLIPRIRSSKKLVYFNVRNLVPNRQGYYDDRIYALNPKKLSSVENFYKQYESNPSQRYKGGSPYEFIIKMPTTKTIKLANGSSQSLYRYSMPAFEVAGKYVYALQQWDTGVRIATELAVYNALTGDLIDSTFNYPTKIDPLGTYFDYINISYGIGSNIVLAKRPGGGSITLTEFNPNLDVVRSGTLSMPAPASAAVAAWPANQRSGVINPDWSVDATGAIYTYSYYFNTNQGLDGARKYDVRVLKFNPDFSLAWSSLLRSDATGLTSGETFAGLFSFSDTYYSLATDPANNEVLAKIAYDVPVQGQSIPNNAEEIVVLDSNTGAIKTRPRKASNGGASDDMTLYHYGNPYFENATSFTPQWTGGRIAGTNRTVTAEGYRTSSANAVVNENGTSAGAMYIPYNNGRQIFGEYFGDGIYVSANEGGGSYPSPQKLRINVSVGTPTTKDKVVKSFTNGQFYSNISLNDAEVAYTFKMDAVNYDNEWLGFSFRMQDPKNRYAFETNGSSIAIAKYVNGARTVLASGTYPMQDNTDYAMRIKFVGSKIDLWLNGIPILNATDGTFTDGRFGYFADKSFVTYTSMRYKAIAQSVVWSNQYAIWDSGTASAEVKYNNLTFIDPENDPVAGSYKWTIQHTPRFINNQGISAKNGQTFTSQQLTFDKVGDYIVKLNARDDPNPNYRMPSMVFDSYRKDSNDFIKKVTVHRRPISNYTVVQGANKKIVWTDYSLDPDRYESAANYSTEDTGIDYRATKGIMEKKFYYISPVGSYTAEKLVTPTEIGTYEIGLAVRDEYDAWSDYTVAYLNVSSLPKPNNPPVAGFTTSIINSFRGVPVTIDSAAYDIEDGGRQNLSHTYYVRNVSSGGTETIQSMSRTSWIKSFNSLGTIAIRQTVEDSDGAISQFQAIVTIRNRLPTAVIQTPDSSDHNNPDKFAVTKPDFRWVYEDADFDPGTQYQVRVYRYGGAIVLDSAIQAGGTLTWKANEELPEKTNLYVVVRTFDGFDWGDWSAPKFFFIETNRPPMADFDWTPKPVFEGDLISLIQKSRDPDGDDLSFEWDISGPSGFNEHFTRDEPDFLGAKPGSYIIKLTVNDGKAQASVAKTITVLPLTIQAEVNHTIKWLDYHERAGHVTDADPKDFYAGEVFVVHAWSSAAPVRRVIASLDTTSIDHKRIYTEIDLQRMGTTNHYQADFLENRWGSLTEGLPKGLHTIRFKIQYSNGTVKETEVPINIIGNMMQIVSVHRRQ
jgi:hypothetical protein